jgi:hypothetical protein
MLNPFKLFTIYSDLNKAEAVAKEKASMNTKVTQYLTLGVSLAGTLGVPTLAANWLHAHAAIYIGFVAAAIVLHAILPSIFAAPSAADQQATGLGSVQKLGVIMLCAILLTGTLPVMGCSGVTVAQDIVNWTPALQSAVGVVDATAAVLDPAAAPIFTAATIGFDAASNLLVVQAKAYLANPNASILAQLQAQIVAFRQQVNGALLSTARIVNPASQQKAMADINAVATVVNTMLALIAGVSSKAAVARMAADSTIKLAQVEPLMNRELQASIVAEHYGVRETTARYMVDRTLAYGQAAGF